MTEKQKKLEQLTSAAAAIENEDYEDRKLTAHAREFARFYRTALLGVIVAEAIEQHPCGVSQENSKYLAVKAYNIAADAMHLWVEDWTHERKTDDKIVEKFNQQLGVTK
jgi:hypothetical protein